jgi:hypothetical protein
MNSDPRKGLPSASSMYRVMNCPGSVALTNFLKRENRYYELPSPEASAGTRIHSYLAMERQGKYEEAELVLEDRYELATARKCIELRESVLSQWLRPTYGGTEQALVEFIIERRLWYRQGLWPRFSGQPDFVILDRTNQRALIVNYKTSRKEAAPAADNVQLRTEVVVLKHNEPALSEISGVIIEPLVTWDSERVEYDEEALQVATGQLLAIVDRAEWEPQNRIAGDWCVYCPARANCLEARAYVETIPSLPASKLLTELPKGETGTALWRRIQVAQKLLKDLEGAYTTILEQDPNCLPDLILPAQGKAKRIIPHPGTLKAALAEHLNESEIDGCATYSVPKVQDALGLKLGIDGKELERKFKELTRDAVQTIHERPFVRERTRKERGIVVLKPEEPKEELAL